jgi:uncharacterized membrane protein
LATVEVTQIEVACGPVGECNIVQSSSYARFLSIPVAILGGLFYLTVALLWLIPPGSLARLLRWRPNGLVALTFAGTLFSIY